MAWTCQGCASSNPDGTRFCGQCGTPAAAAAPAAPAPQPLESRVEGVLRSFVSGAVAERLMESGGQLTEERRLVTALFADLSGFTVLAGRMDPEQLSEVIDPVISGLTDIAGRYGGYVEKFAGDALLAFFGAPVAHEDDADRALQVALDMHAELPGLVRVAGAELTLHVGINTGHVVARLIGSEVRTDYAVLGDAVILAQRLESVTPSGQTYVGAMTHRLTRDRFELEPVGALTLKGRSSPEPAWRLVGRRTEATASGRRLVGREQEVAQLAGLLDRTLHGAGGVAAVVGEPGVGKTRLLEHVHELATARGATWQRAQCVASGGAIPYRPYAELLRRAAQEGSRIDEAGGLDVTLTALGIPDRAPFLRALLGLAPGDQLGLEPEALGRAVDDALVAWVVAMASAAPTVLLLEDAHWADPSSLALTRRLATLTGEIPLALLVTGRPEARGVLGDLDAAATTLLELRGVGDDALRALLEQELGPVSPDVHRLVAERSGGNPLFALELARTLQERGALARTGESWTLAEPDAVLDVPPTVEGLLASRLDLLPRPAVGTLQLAAVVGRRVPLPLLEQASEQRASLPRDLATLYDARLLEPCADQSALFPHALVQDVAYARLLRRQQRSLHLRVADAAERVYGAERGVELLARHLYLARSGERAIPYLEQAGRRAAGLFSNDEARVHLERAVELARETPGFEQALPDLLVDLAEVCALTGRYDESLQRYDEVRALVPDVRAWRGSAAVLRQLGRYGEALDLVARALRQGFPEDAAAALLLERGRVLLSEGKFGPAAEALRAGLELASADSDVMAHLLLQLTRAEENAGDAEAALHHGQRALARLRERGDTRGLATALRVLGGVYDVLGRLDEAAESLREGLTYAERVGNVEEIGACLLNLGLVETHRQRYDLAVEATGRALAEFTRVGHQLGVAAAAANLGEALVALDRYDEALASCEQALVLALQIGDELTAADARLTRAIALFGKGQHDEAAADAETSAAAFSTLGIEPYAARARGMADRARQAAAASERARSVSGS